MKRTDSYKHRQNSLLKRSLYGYLRFFRSILWILAAVCLVALTGFLIVYPLWYFASEYKNTYSLFALGILFLVMLIFFAGKLKVELRITGGIGLWFSSRFFPAIKKLIRVFIAIAALYGIIILFARGHTLIGAGVSVVFLLFLGVMLGGRRESL